jgi:hypothetical protein
LPAAIVGVIVIGIHLPDQEQQRLPAVGRGFRAGAQHGFGVVGAATGATDTAVGDLPFRVMVERFLQTSECPALLRPIDERNRQDQTRGKNGRCPERDIARGRRQRSDRFREHEGSQSSGVKCEWQRHRQVPESAAGRWGGPRLTPGPQSTLSYEFRDAIKV